MKKRILVLIISLVTIITVLFIVFNHNTGYNKQNKLVPISSEKEHEEIVVLQETYEEMAPEEDESEIQDAESRIILTDITEISDNRLPPAGTALLEGYLTQYMDYYWNDGKNYFGYVVEGSYEYDVNFPTFQVYVPSLDLTIDCMYYVSREIYYFWSRFNPKDEEMNK